MPGERLLVQPTLSTAPALPVRSLGEPALLIGRDLWYAYDGHPAVVRGVNLALHRGLVTMMLGRSGSGKTTLLKLLAGLLRPEQGRIEPQIQGLVVSYIPQALGLVRSLSAMENTLVGALDRVGTLRSLVKAFPAPIAHEARQLLARLGLQDKLHEPVARLSGGERQRVAIARALMRRPHVILADEFVSQLDAVTTREILSMMRWLAADGVAVLTATHDADLAAEYADRVAVMASGRLVCERPASELTAVEMLGMLA